MSALPATPTASPKPTGKLRLSAFAVATDDQHHPITRKATMELRHIGSDFSISTNIGIPCLWRNIPTGEHRLSLAIPGFRPSTTNILTVVADATNEIAVAMQPLPARVRFAFPATNVVFDVYNDTRLLGDSTTAYDLTPFVPHYLTFKADGWRTKRVKVQLAEPGTSYRCPIEMERKEVAPRPATDAEPASGSSDDRNSSAVAAEQPTRARQAVVPHDVSPAEDASALAAARVLPDSDSRPVSSWEGERRREEVARIQQLTGVLLDWQRYSFSSLYDRRRAIEEVQRIEEITGERIDWQQLSFSRAYDMRRAAEEIAQLNTITGSAVDWHKHTFSEAYDMRRAAEEIALLNRLTSAGLDWRRYTFSQAYDMRRAAEIITEINQQTGRNYRWQEFTFSKAYDLKMKLGL